MDDLVEIRIVYTAPLTSTTNSIVDLGWLSDECREVWELVTGIKLFDAVMVRRLSSAD